MVISRPYSFIHTFQTNSLISTKFHSLHKPFWKQETPFILILNNLTSITSPRAIARLEKHQHHCICRASTISGVLWSMKSVVLCCELHPWLKSLDTLSFLLSKLIKEMIPNSRIIICRLIEILRVSLFLN